MDGEKAYYKNHRREMIEFLPSVYSTVLEIGCGEGAFRRNLSKPNEYWGVELFASAAALAVKNLDKVLVGAYDGVADQIPDGYFDLVICNDVIEHMTDHDHFLQIIKSKLKPGGSLVASVPNVRYFSNLMALLVGKDWQYANEGILDKTHQRFFTQKSLLRILDENGYVVEKFSGINDGYPWGMSPRQVINGSLIALLGQDVRYLQFAFRIKAKAAR